MRHTNKCPVNIHVCKSINYKDNRPSCKSPKKELRTRCEFSAQILYAKRTIIATGATKVFSPQNPFTLRRNRCARSKSTEPYCTPPPRKQLKGRVNLLKR